MRAAFEQRRGEACSIADQDDAVANRRCSWSRDRNRAAKRADFDAFSTPRRVDGWFSVEVGVLDEGFKVLDRALFVGGYQANVGSATLFGNHPDVAVRRVFWPEIEVQITIVRHVQDFVLEAGDDLDVASHVKELGRRT